MAKNEIKIKSPALFSALSSAVSFIGWLQFCFIVETSDLTIDRAIGGAVLLECSLWKVLAGCCRLPGIFISGVVFLKGQIVEL